MPVTLNPNDFAAGWSWTVPGTYTRLTPATTGSGKVVVAGGTGNGVNPTLYALNEVDGSLAWRHDFGVVSRLNNPAVLSGRAFVAYAGHQFTVIDRSNGERIVTMNNDTFNWRGYSLNIAPVLPGDGSIVVVDGIYNYSETPHDNHLIRYNAGGASEAWRVDGQFRSNPVVDSGNLYVINNAGRRLEARDLASGTVSWSWSPASASETLPIGNTVLTDNLIFLSSSAATYAIDLNTHLPGWSPPNTGHRALSSNRILYIVSVANGRIDSYRLAP